MEFHVTCLFQAKTYFVWMHQQKEPNNGNGSDSKEMEIKDFALVLSGRIIPHTLSLGWVCSHVWEWLAKPKSVLLAEMS